jgi:transmembrane sensor
VLKQQRYNLKLVKPAMTTEPEPSGSISRRAAELAVQFDAGPLSSADLAEAEAWLQRDVRHRGAFARAQAGLIHSRRAAAVSTLDVDRHSATEVAPLGNALLPDTGDQILQPTRRRFMALGGSAVAISVLGLAVFGPGAIGSAKAYATAIGETRVIQLGEAARMTLNTDSRVLVKTQGRSHQITLEQGEALFEVVGGRGASVLVDTGASVAGSAGGSFAIRKTQHMPLQVLVQSGDVNLSYGTAQSAQAIHLTANQRAIEGPGTGNIVTSLSQDKVAHELEWRNGMLAFEDETLVEAAREFARYSSISIELSDPSVGQQTITGLFDSRDPRGFARSAGLSLGMRVQNNPHSVRIGR